VSADQVRARFDAWWKQKSEPLHPSMRFVLSEVAFDGWQAATASHAAEVEALRSALIAARDHIACYVCHHDETQRRGLIWTECLQCGGMFADDQGGVPAPKEPAVLAVIRAALKGD
jgi:ribosomal protein L37AE/L43A